MLFLFKLKEIQTLSREKNTHLAISSVMAANLVVIYLFCANAMEDVIQFILPSHMKPANQYFTARMTIYTLNKSNYM